MSSISRTVGGVLVGLLAVAASAVVVPVSAAPRADAPTVTPASHYDTSPPLRSMRPAQNPPGRVVQPLRQLPAHASTGGSSAAQGGGGSSAIAPRIPATLLNFNGIGLSGGSQSNFIPPDTNGDVGPNHYVQIVNTAYEVFNKSGGVLMAAVATNTIWNGFGGLCQTDNDGDGTVVYDSIANRWVIQQFAVTGANPPTVMFQECVAVSTGPDPTGTYNRYSFPYSFFPDYPKLAVWPDAYYTTYNTFNAAGTQFTGGEVCAFDRTRMLAGMSATQQCFNVGTSFGGLLGAHVTGSRLPAAGTPEYVVSLGVFDGQLQIWRFHVDFVTPANTTLTTQPALATAAFTLPCSDTGGTCVPQFGTTQQLDTLGDRLMYRLNYRNFGDHEAIVVSHSITAGGSSVGERWYELRPSANTLSIFQQGTYAPDGNFRWMGSIVEDQQGNMALGFSESSSSLNPQIHYTGRLAGDPAGMMPQGEGTIINGTGSQIGFSRWGDYSSMSIDPSDDCTFWYTNQYLTADGSFNWSTHIASFKFASCGAPDFTIAANPTTLSIQQGSSGTSTINTTQVGGAGTVSLAASVSPSGPTAGLSPTSVAAGGSSTLTVNVGNAVAPGTYTVTVTGTEGSNVHATTVTVTVTAPPDFTIAANPNALTIQQGGSGTSTINTTQVGPAGTVSLTAGVSPSGPTASLSPTTVAAGSSSTLTVNVGASVPTGTYTVTVTGTEGSKVHATTVTVTVTALPPDFTISANPTAVSIQQGSSGTSTINTTQVGAGGNVSLTAGVSPSGPTASLNPTSVAAGNSSTLTVNVGNSVATGTYTVTVTGTEGSNVHATTVTVTVTAAPDFTISANPTALSIQQGSSGTSTINTTQVGPAGTVSLTAGVSPSGPTAGLSPTSVAAGGSSTLTVNVGNSVAPGTYTVTVTGTEGFHTHAATVTVTVTAAPDFTISANPTTLSIQQGSSGTSTINTTQVGPAGTVSLTAGVSPSGPTAGLSPTSVAAGGSSTLTVNVGSSVATGTYTVTVTGTEGFHTHATTVTVTVTAPPDFTISANPNALTIQQGNSGTSTINTTQVGSPGTVSLAAAVSPAGPTASLSPTSIAAGGSSTLTVSVGNSVATGTYTVTVTGTEGSKVHATTVTVTVTAAQSTIVNGGFETGDFTGWTTAGSTAIVTSPVHSGTHAARVGSTSPFSGDSSIMQTFTAPVGGGTLTFWYQNVCTDTVTYDWALATLTDNTSATTITMLPKTCTNNGTWFQRSAPLTAGHSYTLKLINHDDNYPTDPTYTLFDDVMIGTPPPPSPLVNGGFETGTLSGWTSTGSTGISTTHHSGSYSARVGSTAPFSGDSSISQTFTAPVGSTQLTFWYRVVCTDTVTYDWATATLTDNTTSTTTTVLAKTCTNNGVWVQRTVAVTAGHSYTITFINHDDNYPTDPTYTLFDDVSTL
jgi:hypothetical protein